MKFCWIWESGADERFSWVSFSSERCESRDSESAMMLCLPGMCSGYSVDDDKNSNSAKYFAIVSCCLFATGLNVEWYSQPTALLLSVKARICGNLDL